jgi:hypothetical protein
MSSQPEISTDTALQVAEFFANTGMPGASARVWQILSRGAPFDLRARERVADLSFDLEQSRYSLGSIERSRFLAGLTSKGFPTAKLTAAYFANLDRWLANRPRRDVRGVVVLGIGPGRCGSSTLTAAFAAVDDACATHENHPFIYWQPQEEQTQFHFERLRRLANHFRVVFDAAHWWLNVLERFLEEFPSAKVVALTRDNESCVQSFLNVKGRGAGSVNHWAPPGNGIWPSNLWDPVYPQYPVPTDAESDPEPAKAALVRRYVDEYQQTIGRLAAAHPQRILVLRTEELNDSVTSARLSAHVGTQVTIPEAGLNAGTVSDGESEHFRL